VSTPDVVIVGAGVVGAATADLLTRADVRVTVVESAFAGAGSTGAAMGHLVVMDDSLAQLRLCHLSRLRWAELFEQLPTNAEADRCGTLWLAANAEELQAARDKVAVFRGEGVRAELLDARQLRAAEPSLREGLAGALRVPDDFVCYPPAIARALLERAGRAGATIIRDTAVAIEDGELLLTSGRRLSAAAIVVATGAHAAALVPGLPVVPRRGHLCITDRVPIPVHHQLVELGYLHTAHTLGGASVAFNVQPRRTGQVLIGSSRELVGFAPEINRPLVARMLQRAAGFVPGLARAPISRTWVGFRPATPDALPLIGRWPAMDRTWIAAGHEGLGITMAPVTAELIVAGILGNTPPLDPAPYRPERVMPAAAHAA
jgi:glycine/D-amino acid oxidase-like deaminating enzyme